MEPDNLDEEYRLLAKAREAALSGVRVYNDPLAGFRTESFIVLMVIAWNSLFQALLERSDTEYFSRNEDGTRKLIHGRPKVLETWELAQLALPGNEYRAVLANLDFFLQLRNQIAHRYLPPLDVLTAGEAQSMLLNFENLLVEHYGEESALGDRLVVPLQLSEFRNNGGMKSLKKAQAKLPADVWNLMTQHRADVPDDVLRSPEYSMQIFFVPVAANRERSADAVVHFFRPGEVTPEVEEQLQDLAVVPKLKHVSVASGNLFRPAEVVERVAGRLPFRFTSNMHVLCWKYYQVRPRSGAAEMAVTDDRYCVFDRLLGGYGYTQAWIDKLVSDLSDSERFKEVVGRNAVPH